MKNYLLASALFVLVGSSCETNTGKDNATSSESVSANFEQQDSIFADAMFEIDEEASQPQQDFAGRFMAFLEENPGSITFDFPKLVEAGMHIATSSDAVLRIFSWDDNEGGSMRYFNNIFQVNLPAKNTLSLKSTTEDRTYFPFYNRIETFELDGQTYYLAFARSVLSNSEVDYAVELFTIKDKELEPAYLFKGDLNVEYRVHETINYHQLDGPMDEVIKFDAANLTIAVPVVTSEGQITKDYKTYQYKDKLFQ